MCCLGPELPPNHILLYLKLCKISANSSCFSHPIVLYFLYIRASNSAVECQLPKLDVAGSIPVSRSFSYWAVSSVGSERLVYTQKVRGSNPLPPTQSRLFWTEGFFFVSDCKQRAVNHCLEVKTAGDRVEGCDWLTMRLVGSEPN